MKPTFPSLILLLALALPALAASAQSAATGADKPNAPQMLNLKDADIQAFIATVSEITGKNFILGPNVQGKVTVVSQKPLNAAQIYQVFQQVLAVHGYVTLPAGDGMIKIVSQASARGEAAVGSGPTAVGGNALVTRVVPVHYVSAAELATLLQQFVPQGGQVVAHGPSNSLILSDRADVVNRLQKIIQRVDTASDAHVEVIPLQHANAAEMARTLTQLNTTGGDQGPNAVRVMADTRTNSILLSGSKSRRLSMRTLIANLDTPLESGGSTQVVYLNYANAKDLVPILSGVAQDLQGRDSQGAVTGSGASGASAKPGEAPTTIQADDKTNALVITAPPAVFRSLKAVIRQLDIRRAQVLIEAVIAEVGLSTAKEIGVQWFTAPQTGTDEVGQGLIGGTNFPTANSPGLLGLAQNPLALGGGLSLGYVDGTINIPGLDTPILNLGALIRALQNTGNTNILSTPSVVTLDNQEAEIKVAKEVPFKTGQYTSTSSGGTNLPQNPFQTIERKDVGLTLTVTPHINEGDAVRMDIHQVVSSLAPEVTGAVDLVTNKREVRTSVLVADDSMLVLGGLISNNTSDSNNKVPLLGDIPLLGNLFRYRSNKNEKQDLMVFLHPKILRDAATEAAVSSEKYNYMRTEQLKLRANRALLTPQDKRPLLPEMHDFLANPPLPVSAAKTKQSRQQGR